VAATVPDRGRTLSDITERMPEAADETTEVHVRPDVIVEEPSETVAAIELEPAEEVPTRGVLAVLTSLARRLRRLL
jgi:hypothetical protein